VDLELRLRMRADGPVAHLAHVDEVAGLAGREGTLELPMQPLGGLAVVELEIDVRVVRRVPGGHGAVKRTRRCE
jgi:hypothetical protein